MQAGGSGLPQRRETARAVAVLVLVVAVLTTGYYLVPVPGRMSEASWTVLYFGGTAALAVVIVLTVLRLVRAGPDTRIRSLIALLCVAILFFSWADVVLAKEPGQFSQLHTKMDALYFAISTLATVGFGDVHASGQLARAAVTVQIVFNLVFLGLAITTLTGWLRRRAGALRWAAGNEAGSGQPDQR